MPALSRLAVGTVQEQATPQFMTWAMLGLLGQNRQNVQRFVGRACSPRCGAGQAIDGNAPRHLDSWVMSQDVCRELFFRPAKRADLSLVDGCYQQGRSSASDLSVLADHLDLPQLVVVDVTKLDGCHIPTRPEGATALLLDGVRNESEFFRVQTNLEALWGIPVVGGLDRLETLRREVEQQPCAGASPEVIAQLARSLARYTITERLHHIAARPWSFDVKPCIFRREKNYPEVTIAVACDGFTGYFPETIEVLEYHGAKVINFSPVSDEALPDGVDMVYFGCGQIENFAEKLSDNMCMALSLRNHLCAGRRIIAEGAGVAYLCQHVELGCGKSLPMVGILPCIAKQQSDHHEPVPVEAKLRRECWLAPNQSCIRGYRSGTWQLHPSSEVNGLTIARQADADVLAQGPLVAFDFNLHLASQASLLRHFFRPRAIESVRGSTNAIVW